jgi:hypothetical protein
MKYSLPPTDPRFLNATIDEIMADFFMHQHMENGGKEVVEDDEYDQEAMLARLDAGLSLDELKLPDDFEEI